ncbi:MAG: hypothetical protein GXP28_02765 [Planctomycetes bacterium]|nr:hypothetical protein [Planctomycetota bacterium]
MILDSLPMILATTPLGVWAILWNLLVLLTMALVLGTIALRLGQSVIVGYLIAGTLVGPHVLGWVSIQGELFNIAELGVALLLFSIGLEFSPRRLKTLGRVVLKAGPLQVVLTAALGFAASIACGFAGKESLVIGLMVTMSSTACVMRLLTDRAEVDSQHGRTALGVLLVQDVAVVPMMLLVSNGHRRQLGTDRRKTGPSAGLGCRSSRLVLCVVQRGCATASVAADVA